MAITVNGSTGISGVDGSAATPALQGGDSNTGISFGTDTVAISTNGTERVEFGTSEVVFNDGGENYDFRIEGDTNSSLFFVDASADKVGIGTTTPAGGASIFIDVYGSASSTVNFHNATTGTTSGDGGVVGQYGSDLVLYNYENGILQFGTNNLERMRISSGGDVLIAATVYSGTGLSLSPPDASGCYAQSTGTGSRNIFRFGNANGTIGAIQTGGSTTTYATSSDYRLKENVSVIPDSITRLQQLKPCRFNFKADPTTTVDGFIAHEVQAVIPEAVTGTKDEVDADGSPIYQGIDQSKLVPLLTAALQEAVAEINALKDRVAALEAA